LAQQRNAFKLGVATLIMLALFVAVLVFISGRDFGPPTQGVTVRFPTTMTLPVLKAGSPIFCAGKYVGAVASVRMQESTPQTGDPQAPVLYLYVDASVHRQIGLREDSKIIATGPLLGGTGQLIIRDRGRSSRLLADGAVIDGQPTGSLEAVTEALARELDDRSPGSLLGRIKAQLDPQQAASLVSKIHQSLDDLNDISRQISRQMDPAERGMLLSKVHGILDSINAATAAISDELARTNDASMLAKAHQSMDTMALGLKIAVAMLQENRAPLGETLLHLQHMSEELDRRIVGQLVSELAPDQPANLMGKIHASFDRVIAALDDVSVVAEGGRELFQVNQHNVNAALDNLKTATGVLKGGLKYVARHPWVLFTKPTPAEQEQMNVVEAAREFTEATGQLDDALARLQALLTVHNGAIPSSDERFAEARAELERAMGKFTQAEARLWQRLGVR